MDTAAYQQSSKTLRLRRKGVCCAPFRHLLQAISSDKLVNVTEQLLQLFNCHNDYPHVHSSQKGRASYALPAYCVACTAHAQKLIHFKNKTYTILLIIMIVDWGLVDFAEQVPVLVAGDSEKALGCCAAFLEPFAPPAA